ncbi:hypothetical protein J3R30DRAFT_3699842 [Lentinula aciculospora]|uniref:AMP-dependent synthetase/ligase domain-containing protein n=1 Tax=Lentinula aciculospora TaxID=153920 RepID=A0A9W9DR27_9AGAR|nr:hypothetical protein J3R30DRAFT_3699842 [Lentinula aciculospora]
MSINEAQGQSLYVALSRSTSKGGVKILFPDDNDTCTTKNIVYPEIVIPTVIALSSFSRFLDTTSILDTSITSIWEEKEMKKFVNGKEVVEEKKWKYFELSDYKYINFIELKEAVSEIARGLVEIGVTSDDVFNIFSQTSGNRQLMANACGSISTTIATAIFTNAGLLSALYKVLANKPSIIFVVYDGEPSDHLVSDINAVRKSIKVSSIDHLRELGKSKPTKPLKARLPKPETMASSISAIYTRLGHHLTYVDTYLAYPPLTHVLEYIVELIMLFVGMTSGYGRVNTLTDASVRQGKGDLAAFQPSIMVGVPLVWETIRKGIVAKVNGGGSVRRSVFNGAMSLNKNSIPMLSQVADSIVLKSVWSATGGRLRITLPDGAALSHETQKFLDTALAMILQGNVLSIPFRPVSIAPLCFH